MTRREEIIWLAGLLEGEGYFGIHPDRRPGDRRGRLEVRLKMTDRDVVERAAGLFPSGASVRPVIDPRPRKSDCYRIGWNGATAESVMRAVLPYMGERRAAKIRECLATPNLSHHPRPAAPLSVVSTV